MCLAHLEGEVVVGATFACLVFRGTRDHAVLVMLDVHTNRMRFTLFLWILSYFNTLKDCVTVLVNVWLLLFLLL